ncbi:MAG: nucleoside phosphorylase, partial [Anaerolineaceae bacterium]|nr:nucleoside phosphorylase [Anaerolineaceae bacterium]
MQETFPILEFDANPNAIIEPKAQPLTGNPSQRVVLCFFHDVLAKLAKNGTLETIGALKSEMGENPIYQIKWEGQNLVVCHPGVGAPLAAGFLDELISLGLNKFIACGGCGVINDKIDAGAVVILTSAVRDEGTTYHYLPPSREVGASPIAIAALEKTCAHKGMSYRLGKSWTTDAIFRETVLRRAARLAEGCDVVEMEAAAFFAVAKFRGVAFGQVVYGGDLVVPHGWDYRDW